MNPLDQRPTKMLPNLIPDLKMSEVVTLIPLVDEVPACRKGIPVMTREIRSLLLMVAMVLTANEELEAVDFVDGVLHRGHLERYGDYDLMVSLIPFVEQTYLQTNHGTVNISMELQHWLDYYYHLKYNA